MSNIINNRYKHLKKIYSSLGEMRLLKEGEIVNYDEIIRDLYHLNKLLNQTQLIFRSGITKNQMITKISNLKDINGKRFLSKSLAKEIVELNKTRISSFYEQLENRMAYKVGGGYEKEEYYSNNQVYDYLKKYGIDKDTSLLDVVSLIKKMSPVTVSLLFDGIPIEEAGLMKNLSSSEVLKKIEKNYPLELIINMRKYIGTLSLDNLEKKIKEYETWVEENKDMIEMVKAGLVVGPKGVYKVSKYIFDWVFFPLYQLENLPVVGPMFEIPLDTMGIMIDNSGLFFEGLSTVVPKGLDLLTDVISIVPGVGSAAGAIGVGVTLTEKPLAYMIQHGPDLLGLFVNVQRKQWGLAYMSMLEVVPGFASLMDASVTNLYTANKWAYKGVKFSDFFKESIITSRTLSKPFLNEPQVMFQPMNLWSKVVYPNRKRLPIMRDIPFDTIERYLGKLKEGYNMASGLTQNILDKGNFNPKENIDKFMNAAKSGISDPTKMASDLVNAAKGKTDEIKEKAEKLMGDKEKLKETAEKLKTKGKELKEKGVDMKDKAVKEIKEANISKKGKK